MSRRRKTRRLAVVAAFLGAWLVLPVVPATQAAPAAASFVDAGGIHVVAVRRLDQRQYNISVLSRALGRPVNVRLLLPAGYDPRSASRYPVLYLFHGTSGRASDWVDAGGAEAATAALPLIVVMPDAGFDGDGGGWFTNWVDTATALGPSQWETFHVGQLVSWVDANLRTVADRHGRAIAGLSQGGFGSTTYAARHPDMFVSAASFSGAPDIDYDPAVALGATAVIEATAFGLDGVEPDAMFGSRLTDEINWQGHDPADLVTNLRATDVWVYTATGAPGPYDANANLPAMGVEALTHASSLSFAQRAQQVGVGVHLQDYTYGTHSWPYWARDLRQYLGHLMATFSHSPAPPRIVSYESIDKSWSQWGWSVDIQRSSAQAFSGLTAAGPAGFTLTGTGHAAAVVTPPFYRPGSVKTVRLSAQGVSAVERARADSRGRLHLRVALPFDGALSGVTVLGIPPAGAGGPVAVTISP